MNIQPIKINSNLVSAQNRNRLFWTNINSESDGLFGDLVCKIPQPKDKGILLKDILESEVDEKYFRPTEVDLLIGDSTKAKNLLGWEPKYTVEELCQEMVLSDFSKIKIKIIIKTILI
jgi:GDP-D-mannose dehydratase